MTQKNSLDLKLVFNMGVRQVYKPILPKRKIIFLWNSYGELEWEVETKIPDLFMFPFGDSSN